MEDKILIVPIRKFDQYSVSFNQEFTKALGKQHWLTNENYVYYLGEKYSNEWVVVPRGYATDGATVPPAFQSILPVFGKHGSAVILHDWLCEYGFVWHRNLMSGEVTKRVLTREEIDNVFLEALAVIEMDPGTIHWVKLGFATHRALSRPKVPNMDHAKQLLEFNYAQSKGYHPFDGSLLYDVIDHPPLWAIA
jgi:hypothetical protein